MLATAFHGLGLFPMFALPMTLRPATYDPEALGGRRFHEPRVGPGYS